MKLSFDDKDSFMKTTESLGFNFLPGDLNTPRPMESSGSIISHQDQESQESQERGDLRDEDTYWPSRFN